GLQQRLSIGVAGDEVASDQTRADHVVDGVSPGAPYPDNRDTGLHLLLVLRNAQIDHAVPSAATQLYDTRSGPGSPFAGSRDDRASDKAEFASKVLSQPVTQSTEEPVWRLRMAGSAAQHLGPF